MLEKIPALLDSERKKKQRQKTQITPNHQFVYIHANNSLVSEAVLTDSSSFVAKFEYVNRRQWVDLGAPYSSLLSY